MIIGAILQRSSPPVGRAPCVARDAVALIAFGA